VTPASVCYSYDEMPRALNPKQQRFVAEYLIDLNATQAAVRAGYSAKTARKIGSRLLTKEDIQAAIDTIRRRQVSRDRPVSRPRPRGTTTDLAVERQDALR
jgi:hypothetical protein